MADADRPFEASYADGYYAVRLDPLEDRIVWWGADHPKGAHPYEEHQSIDSFLRQGPRFDGVPPADVLDALKKAVARHVANPPARSPEQRLVLAARRGDRSEMEDLLARGASPDAVSPSGKTAFWTAVEARNEDAAVRLLDAGADPTRGLPEGALPRAALARTLMYRLFRASERVLARGVRLDDDRGERPIWLHAIGGHAPVALLREMVKAGADFDRRHPIWQRQEQKARIASDAEFAAWVREISGTG